jgi:hypothetical protein
MAIGNLGISGEATLLGPRAEALAYPHPFLVLAALKAGATLPAEVTLYTGEVPQPMRAAPAPEVR